MAEIIDGCSFCGSIDLKPGDLVEYTAIYGRTVYAFVETVYDHYVIVNRGTDGRYQFNERELTEMKVKKIDAYKIVDRINEMTYRNMVLEGVLQNVKKIVGKI